VKALAVAQSQGQKVFTVTSQNVAAVLPQLSGHSQQTRADVQNAVNAGKEVTISQARITYSGWTGAGYVIIDPQTGAGSYLIEGGANGGWLGFLLQMALITLLLAPAVAFLISLVVAFGGFLGISILTIGILVTIIVQNDLPFEPFVFAIVRFIGAVVIALLGVPGATLALMLAFFALLAAEFFWLLRNWDSKKRLSSRSLGFGSVYKV
jgi:hypothetical protein